MITSLSGFGSEIRVNDRLVREEGKSSRSGSKGSSASRSGSKDFATSLLRGQNWKGIVEVVL